MAGLFNFFKTIGNSGKEDGKFEDELTKIQVDMVDICNEYSCSVADKIFIYVGYEDLQYAMHFYRMGNEILMPGKLKESGLDADFDVSIDCQEQVLDILNEDVDRIKVLCDQYEKPMPTEMRLTYETKTKKFAAEFKYDKQTTDDISVFDNQEKWFNEEKSKQQTR